MIFHGSYDFTWPIDTMYTQIVRARIYRHLSLNYTKNYILRKEKKKEEIL